MLNLGDKLKHIETGLEAEYVAPLLTGSNGFLHLLKTADGYVHRLTGDLEAEFSRPETTAPLSETDGSAAANESRLLDALIKRLKAEGVITTPTPVAAPAPAPVAPAPVATAPTPTVPDASAHLPAAQTDAPSEGAETPVNPTPPPDSIPL